MWAPSDNMPSSAPTKGAFIKQAQAKVLSSECRSNSLKEFRGLFTRYWYMYGDCAIVFPRSVVFLFVVYTSCGPLRRLRDRYLLTKKVTFLQG